MPTYRVKVAGNEYEVSVTDGPSGRARVTVEGQVFEVEPTLPHPAAAPPPVHPAPPPAQTAPTSARQPSPVAGAPGSGRIQAPIPGVVTKVLVAVGDHVAVGQVVLKLEAMKMENDIATNLAGTVTEIAVSEGSEVGDGQLLVVVE